MNLLHPVAFPGYNLRSVPYKDASSLSTPRMTTRFSWNYCNKCPLHASFSLSMPSNRSSVACQATTETEPERNHEKNKDAAATPASSNLKNSLERIDSMLRAQDSIQNKAEPAATESSDLKDSIERIDGVLENSIERTDDVLRPPDNIQKKDDEMDVASGSPLPGIKQVGEPIMIPKATIDILKDQVFGFDTFFVTSQEPYEQGVLFKGNLRGKAAKSFEKMTTRMQDRFGDQYRFFLLINPEDDEPVAVVVPDQTLQPQSTAVPEWFAAGAFGLVTIFTLLLRNVPALQSNLLSTFDNLELLKDGFPGAFVTVLVLGIHEIGHILVAREIGAKLGVPYFVPSWQASSRLSSVAIALLGISSLFNDVAFYWVVLIFFLQRGPIAPLSEEITEPESKYVGLGVAILLLGLLICLPYPFPFVSQRANFDF